MFIKILLPFLAAACLGLSTKAQRIKAPDTRHAVGIATTAGKAVKLVKPVQPKKIGPKDYIMPQRLPFTMNPGCITAPPFTFVNFVAARQQDGPVIKLTFKTVNEYTSRNFLIEKAYARGTENKDIVLPADTCYTLFAKTGRVDDFTVPDSTKAKNRQDDTCSYKVSDKNSFAGITFYRIKQVDFSGHIVATQIIAVPGMPPAETVAIYPNPVVNSAYAKIYTRYAGNSTIQMISMGGKVVKLVQATLVKGENNINLNVPGLPGGMYIVSVARAAHNSIQGRLLKQ